MVVARGEALPSPSVTRRVVEEFARHRRRPDPPENLSRLTPRYEHGIVEPHGRTPGRRPEA